MAHPGDTTGLDQGIREIGARLKLLEDRYSNLRKKSQLTDAALLEAQNTLQGEMHNLGDQMLEIKRSLADLNEKLVLLLGELSEAATKSDVLQIERYVDFWQPADFVTQQQLRETLKRSARAVQEHGPGI